MLAVTSNADTTLVGGASAATTALVSWNNIASVSASVARVVDGTELVCESCAAWEWELVIVDINVDCEIERSINIEVEVLSWDAATV